MRSISRRWRTVLLALPILGALGFGATQALAAPASLPSKDCRTEWRCWDDCPEAGGYEVVAGMPCACCPY